MCEIFHTDAIAYLNAIAATRQEGEFHLTFLDPPFNQGKEYAVFDDNQPQQQYWAWLKEVCAAIHRHTAPGGCIYFMHREKNAERVLSLLRQTGWTFQNLIIWRKLTSAVPQSRRFGKGYQIIAFATRGDRPRVFHRLRIDPPLPAGYTQPRESGVFVTDVWDDIRELTSGYYAGDEALRDGKGERLHKQQSPVALLLRIILASTNPGDLVFDPFAGTGTTLVVARQLGRRAIGAELDERYVQIIRWRLTTLRPADDVSRWRGYYRYTQCIDSIWPTALEDGDGQQQLLD